MEQVAALLDEAEISYVKWDMNPSHSGGIFFGAAKTRVSFITAILWDFMRY